MSESPRPSLSAECAPWSASGAPGSSGVVGALVLHGFTGCPQSMRPVAEALADAGFAVELPLLPGHGTTVDDLIATTWDDWAGAAEKTYDDLAGRCDRVVVVGLSMGGALAVALAALRSDVAGVVAVNPAVRIDPSIVELAEEMLAAGQDRIPGIGDDIADPDGHEVAYDETPLAPLLSLAEAATRLRPRLGDITCPLLVMTSPEDHTVPPADSDELAAAVAGPVERVTLARSYHVATLDHDRELIRDRAVEFARRVTSR